MENTRELALGMLMEINQGKAYSHILIREVLDKYDYLESRDKDFVKRLTEGTLERMIQIDFCLNQFSKVPVSKMKPLIRNLLRMSVYQILFMDGVPDHAVCNEAVKLAVKRGFGSLKGYVNGVLRAVARNKETICWPNPQDRVAFLSVMYSVPEWLAELWIDQLGEQTQPVLEALLAVHPVTVRLKAGMTAARKQAWLDQLASEQVEVQQHPYLEYAMELRQTGNIAALPGFAEGLFTVQDVSSMLVTEAAGIKGGEFILDVCAAPGGKACHAAERTGSSGRVAARDLTEHKTALISENAARMGLNNITVATWDARTPDQSMIGQADIVFADLPCSGLGVLGKKRDIKYKITKASLTGIVQLQKEILTAVWQYVKPGGILIYSTCTINRAENEEMVDWFIGEYPFRRATLQADESAGIPDILRNELQSENSSLQLLPGIHQTDGFFIARLERFDYL